MLSAKKTRLLYQQSKKHARTKRSLWTLYSLKGVVVFGVVVTMGCLFYLWQWSNYLKSGFEIQKLEKQKSKYLEQIELLEIEHAYLTRPQRLHVIAQKLQLTAPQSSQVRVLSISPEEPHAE